MLLSRHTNPLAGILLAALVLSGCAAPPAAPPATAPAPPASDSDPANSDSADSGPANSDSADSDSADPGPADSDPADPGQVWLSEDQRLYFYPPEAGLTVGYLGHGTGEGMSSTIVHNATVLDIAIDDRGETITAREQTVYSIDIDGEIVDLPMDATLSYLTEPDGTLHLPANRFMGAGATISGDAWLTVPGPERLLAGSYDDTARFTMNAGGDASLGITLDYTVTSSGWVDDHNLAVTMSATAHSTFGDASGSDGANGPMQITVDWVFQPGYGVISEHFTTEGDGISASGALEHADTPADIGEHFG